MDIDLKQLKELMRSIKQFDVAELEIEKDGERIKLCRGTKAQAVYEQPSMIPSMPAAPAAPSAAPSSAPEPDDASIHYVTSPFVGTFYESPSPKAAAFVSAGAEIKRGQALCIIEAMKLMNEIESDVDGTVLEVLAQNGKAVEYGDKLFKVKKKG